MCFCIDITRVLLENAMTLFHVSQIQMVIVANLQFSASYSMFPQFATREYLFIIDIILQGAALYTNLH